MRRAVDAFSQHMSAATLRNLMTGRLCLRRPPFEKIINELEAILAAFTSPRLRYADMLQLHRPHRRNRPMTKPPLAAAGRVLAHRGVPEKNHNHHKPSDSAAVQTGRKEPIQPVVHKDAATPDAVATGTAPVAPNEAHISLSHMVAVNPGQPLGAPQCQGSDKSNAPLDQHEQQPLVGPPKQLKMVALKRAWGKKLHGVAKCCAGRPDTLTMHLPAGGIDGDSDYTEDTKSPGSSLFSRRRNRRF
jgi:hypothetical protein